MQLWWWNLLSKNRDAIVKRAKNYYENDKERLREQARDKYKNLTEKENKWKAKNRYDNLSEEKKQRQKRISKKLLWG